MRTPLVVVLAFVFAAPALADERTWTIATGVFTTKAELIAVRGELAYLKIGGKIEEYPLNRLSAADQRYIASLSLAPVLPGPGDDTGATPAVVTTSNDILPTPGPTMIAPINASAGTTDRSLLRSGPVLTPPVAEEAIPLPPTQPTTTTPTKSGPGARTSNYGSANYSNATPPSTLSNQLPYRGTSAQSLNALNGSGAANSNARRTTQQQQLQNQAQKKTTAQQNQTDPGLLGIRARRNTRAPGR